MEADLFSRFKAEQDGGQLSDAITPRASVASVARRAIQSRRGLTSAIAKGCPCALWVRTLSVTTRRQLPSHSRFEFSQRSMGAPQSCFYAVCPEGPDRVARRLDRMNF